VVCVCVCVCEGGKGAGCKKKGNMYAMSVTATSLRGHFYHAVGSSRH
jgi:hypothetical protein